MADLSLQIQELRNSTSQIRVIHYGCESWYNVKDRPVAVSCIAVVDFLTKDQVSFSLTDHKEDNEKHRTRCISIGICTLRILASRLLTNADRFGAKDYGDIARSVTEKTQMIAFLGNKFLKGTLETKDSGPRLQFAKEAVDAIQVVLQIGDRFKTVSRQLKHRHANRSTLDVNDEYDFQDLFHALLRLFFDDVRAEEWTELCWRQQANGLPCARTLSRDRVKALAAINDREGSRRPTRY